MRRNKYQPLDKYTSQNSKSHRMRWLIVLFLFMILAIVAYFLVEAKIDNIEQGYQHIYYGINTLNTQNDNFKNLIDQGQPVTLLLVGTNFPSTGRLGEEQAKVIDLVTLTSKNKGVLVTKLPSELVQREEQTLAELSADMTRFDFRQEIQDLVGQPISRTIEIQLANIRPIVEVVGTITTKFDHEVTIDGKTYPAGSQLDLTGRQVEYLLGEIDSDSTLKQSNRSSQIVIALIQTLIEYENLGKVDEILVQSENAIKTDMTFNEVKSLISKRYLSARTLDNFELISFADYSEHDGDKLRIDQSDLDRARNKVTKSLQALTEGQ